MNIIYVVCLYIAHKDVQTIGKTNFLNLKCIDMKTKKQRILENIANDKEIQKRMPKHMDNESFYDNAARYISAIKQTRMMCNIESVSNSGMSRNIRFFEMDGSNKTGYRVYNFYAFFLALGYTKVNDRDTFRISGCGMDMIFHTNYTIIHMLQSLGFITEKECALLAQKTPHVI
jgi:hypothetical protein